MITIKKILPLLLAFAYVGTYSANLSAKEQRKSSSYLSLSLEELGKVKITIATGSATGVNEAPAVATVITADDIQRLGLSNIDQVLQIVPGLHVSVSPLAYSPIYTFRGIRSSITNPQILMLQNGVPITSIFAGDRGILSGGLSINHIARIEVIRGPGSALYGADAYAGVINIVTKTAEDLEEGIEIGGGGGSFNTRDVWMLGNQKHKTVNITSYLSVNTTEGHKRKIEADGQTANDLAFSTDASQAPGSTSTGYDALDGHIDISNSEWRFRSGLNIRQNLGSGAGVAQSLDPDGNNESHRWTMDLTYKPELSNKNWEPEIQASFMDYHEKSDLSLYPAGSDFSGVGGSLFPDGMIGNPEKWERHFRLSANTIYTGWEQHSIRIGVGHSKADLYKVKESKNYEFAGIAPVSLGSVVNASADDAFIQPQQRTLNYVFLQDEWDFTDNWSLTTGIRYDAFSDFGNTTNPRVALVWNTSDTVTTKILYGEAFRAPAFSELYSQNNPVVTGNTALKPEKMKTIEAAINWQVSPALNIGANIYSYEMQDIIRYVPNSDPNTGSTAANAGSQEGKGVELEWAWDAYEKLRIQGNYALQESTDKITGSDTGLAPENTLHLRAHWQFSEHWSNNLQINWVGNRQREFYDTRDPIDDYTLVNFSVNKKSANQRWSLALSILNVFDVDAREPSPGPSDATSLPAAIPNDLPLAGRAIFLQTKYQF